jgi:hypothetical protein
MEFTVIYPHRITTLYETRVSAEFGLHSLIVKRITANSESEMQHTVKKLLVEQWGDQWYEDVMSYFGIKDGSSAEQDISKLDGKGCLRIIRDLKPVNHSDDAGALLK